MRVEILKTAGDVARRAASLFEEAVATNPSLSVALPTGRTPVAMYEILAAERQANRFDLGLASVFNLDEVLLAKEMPQTFFQFMTRHAWGPLGVAENRRFIPQGETADAALECARYERAIEASGGLDLAILGIGADGHIAYNLPDQIGLRTHLVTLDERTVATLGGHFEGPVRAITMGIDTIKEARSILLLATGASKAEALKRMRDDAPADHWPCTYLRGHHDLTVLADESAASQL